MPQDLPVQNAVAPACIGRGTLVDTYHGSMPVEDLLVDDLVMTKDAGFQPIRWIGSTTVAAKGRMAPVRIARNALGNSRTLFVSQQHRILLTDWRSELLFGEREVLVSAKSIINDSTIWLHEGGSIEYFHLLFDRHQIIYTEDCPSESFHPGAEGMDCLPGAARDEILELFPGLANGWEAYGPSVRLVLKPYEVKALHEYRA